MWTSPSTTQAHLAHRHLGPWNPGRAWSPPDWPVERGRYKAECASRESHAHGAHISLPSLPFRQKSTQPTSAAARCGRTVTRGLGCRTQRRDAVAAGQGVGVERRGGRRCLRHRRRQHIRVPRRHPAALRRPLHQFLHQVRPSVGYSVPPFFFSALNQSDLECFRSCPAEFLDFIGFMRTRRSGFGRYSRGPRRRMLSTTSMSS